jgi:hypothetical protein
MGRMLKATEQIAPTHPHTSVAGREMATIVSPSMASIIDRVRDMTRRAS